MRRIRDSRVLLVVGLGLLILYLTKDFSDHKPLEKDSITKAMSSDVFLWPKCQKNISAANITGFHTLPALIQDFLYHQHCRHFPMLINAPNKCGQIEGPSDVFLLLVIKSSPQNYERREVLRKTWAEERLFKGVWIRRVFISGTVNSGFEKVRTNKQLELENQEYNDILQWDFEDTFYNLTVKQILFLEWMEMYCPNARFLLNGDDDVFANTDNMVEYLQNLKDNDGGKHLYAGNLVHYLAPVRSMQSKYYIPVQVHESDLFPPYCSGGGFLLSGYTAMVIYNMSRSIALLPIDDVYMGMCLAKAGLRPVPHVGVKTLGMSIPSTKIDQLDPCYYKEILLVHRFLPSAIYTMWQRIHEPHLKCEHFI